MLLTFKQKHVNFPGQIPAVFNKIARHTQTQPLALAPSHYYYYYY